MTNEVADGPEPGGEPRADRPWPRRLVALLIVAAWVTWAVPAWQSSLHEVGARELVADTRAGRVEGFAVVENVRQPYKVWRIGLDVSWAFGFAPTYDTPAVDAEGRPLEGAPSELLYTVEGGRTRWVPNLNLDGPDPLQALQESGARPFSPATAPPMRDWALIPSLVMFALLVGSLWVRPPRRGTRPFWVFVDTLPAGVGLLTYALSELVLGPPPGAESPRLRWLHGFGIAVAGGLLLSGLLHVVL